MLGFHLGSDNHKGLIMDYGLQTQYRMHIHEVPIVDADTRYDRLLDLGRANDRRLVMNFLDKAGEEMIRAYAHMLTAFGNRFVYRQTVGIKSPVTLERTMFAFNSLELALKASLELQAEIQINWLAMARQLAQESVKFTFFPGVVFQMLQLAVPSFAIIFPSKEDRKNGNVALSNPVWVMPFTVCGPQQALAPGGVVFESVFENNRD